MSAPVDAVVHPSLRRFEFVLMNDGKTINRYECTNGRYVLYDDAVRLLPAESQRSCARCGMVFFEQREQWPIYPMCDACEQQEPSRSA